VEGKGVCWVKTSLPWQKGKEGDTKKEGENGEDSCTALLLRGGGKESFDPRGKTAQGGRTKKLPTSKRGSRFNLCGLSNPFGGGKKRKGKNLMAGLHFTKKRKRSQKEKGERRKKESSPETVYIARGVKNGEKEGKKR